MVCIKAGRTSLKINSMTITTAKRLEPVKEYYFSGKLREIERLNKEGNPVINLGIGSPDLPPHPEVIDTLRRESEAAGNHAYQGYKGIPALRQAIAGWYRRFYGVQLDPETQVLPLMGSKEGIMHICMTYLGDGDQALVPDPGYPTYGSAVQLAGAEPVYYALKETNDWLPDYTALEAMDLSAVKLMFVNYPHMPSGKKADRATFAALVDFAQRHHILLVHDNPYSFILNAEPLSIFCIEAAKEVALELNSLSKSHNMAGWRIGMLCGAPDRIAEVMRFRSNMDSGMFLPLQLAAVKALDLHEGWYSRVNAIYAARKAEVCTILDHLGCSYAGDQAGMFVWARVPEHYHDGFALSDVVLERCRIFITPGGIFGHEGQRYIRVSLCTDLPVLQEAVARITAAGFVVKQPVAQS